MWRALRAAVHIDRRRLRRRNGCGFYLIILAV
jgi:hypothetical protein